MNTAIANQSLFDQSVVYPVVETFHSVQGEGSWAGTSAFFIRLAGCDVGCPWCDTKLSWNAKRHPYFSVADLTAEVVKASPAIAIITGGEPLLHDLAPLTRSLKKQNIPVHLETSGSHPFSGEIDWVTFSPKQFKSPHPSIYSLVSELKVVVVTEFDLKWAEQQAALISPDTPKFLQPEWNSPQSKDLIMDYVLQNPQWRVSLQTHKFLQIR